MKYRFNCAKLIGTTAGNIFVAICLLVFAFSTIISRNLFGKVNAVYLFGEKSKKIYALIAVAFTFLGACLSNDLVRELTDMLTSLWLSPTCLRLLHSVQ